MQKETQEARKRLEELTRGRAVREGSRRRKKGLESYRLEVGVEGQGKMYKMWTGGCVTRGRGVRFPC